MLTIMRGPSGCGKTQSLYRAIIDSSLKYEQRNFLCVVPEQFTIATQRLLTEMHPRNGILNIDVLSFDRLAHRIFEEAGGDASEILDDTGKNLVIRQIASEHSADLTVLGSGMKKTGYVSQIKSVISEFLQYDIDPERLEDMIDISSSSPYLAAKLKDVRVIYNAFRSKLGKEYITKEELLAKACRSAENAGFLKNSTICFDGFTGFTPVQYRFMKKLYELSGDMYVTVLDDGSGDSLFGLGAKTVQNLEKLSDNAEGEVFITDVNDGRIMRHEGKAVFTFLEGSLFRTLKTLKNKAVFADDAEEIKIVAASDPVQEVRYLCSSIISLVREKKLRYRDIAVIMGDTAEYSGILKRSAAENGIPVFIDETAGITLNPYTELIRAAISIMEDDFSYEAVFHFLRTGLTDMTVSDIDRAENYVRALGIRGRKKYSDEWTAQYKGIDESTVEAAERVRGQVMELMSLLPERGHKHSAGDITRAVYDLTVKLDIEEKLRRSADTFEDEKDMVRAGEYRQIYALIIGLFDRIVDLLNDEQMDLGEYARILDAGFSEIRVGSVPPLSDCVLAGDMTRSRFGEIKALFFIGLSDGIIPVSGSKGGIISDLDRQFLKDNDFELAPTAEEKTDTEKLCFYMNVTKPTEYLYLSYPGTASDGSTRKPSYFLNTVKKLFSKCSFVESASAAEGKIYTGQNAFERLSEEIAEAAAADTAAADTAATDTSATLLYRCLEKDPANADILHHMKDAAFGKAGTSSLSKAAARAVFGDMKLESATELEKFAACEYAHFLQFGLRLEERYDFEFEARDIGTVLHGILSTYSDMLKEKGLDFRSVGDSESDAMLLAAAEGTGEGKAMLVLGSSARNAYMQKRLLRMAKRTVDTIRYQVKQGSFNPSAFEKRFEHNGLKGFIDRVDRVSDGQDIYIDIVDYKSGNKDFDMDRIYYGLDLQLVIYLSAAMDAVIREDNYKNVHPAGIFYYHLDDPVVDAGNGVYTDESVAAEIRKKLKLRGMVNRDSRVLGFFDSSLKSGSAKSEIIPYGLKNDGSEDAASSAADEKDFEVMMRYADRKAHEFRDRILSGSVRKEPYELDSHTACDYCQYSVICDGGTKKKLKKMNFPGDFQ